MKVKHLPTNWYNYEISLVFELLSTFTENVEQQITIEVKKYEEEMLEKLYAQIGQQKVEIDWLKKKLQ